MPGCFSVWFRITSWRIQRPRQTVLLPPDRRKRENRGGGGEGSSGTQPREDGSSDSGTDSKTRPFSAARHAPKLNAKEADPSDSADRVITAEFMDTPNKVIIKKVDQNGKRLDCGEFTFTDPNGNKIVKTNATGTDIDASMQGAVVLEGLIPGTWTYQETKAPDGYQIDNNVYKLTNVS